MTIPVTRRAVLPFVPYQPQPPSKVAETIIEAPTLSDGLEVAGQTIPWPLSERTIFTSSKAWSACDVFLQTSTPMLAGSVFSVRIYAVLPSGIRTIIASGRLGHFHQSGPPGRVPFPTWVAAARGRALKFEVSLLYSSGVGGGVSGEQIAFSVICSDQGSAPPPALGAIPMGTGIGFSLDTTDVPDPELLSVQGVIGAGVAAPRWLHVHDSGSSLVTGKTPMFCFPLGAASGGGNQWKIFRRSGSGVFQVVASSTPGTTTIAVDCFCQGVVR